MYFLFPDHQSRSSRVITSYIYIYMSRECVSLWLIHLNNFIKETCFFNSGIEFHNDLIEINQAKFEDDHIPKANRYVYKSMEKQTLVKAHMYIFESRTHGKRTLQGHGRRSFWHYRGHGYGRTGRLLNIFYIYTCMLNFCIKT